MRGWCARSKTQPATFFAVCARLARYSEMNIDRALLDRRLLGAALADPATWAVWLAVLKAAFGLKLNDTELALFGSAAGDRKPPRKARS